ncbi:MAG: transposase [Nitrosomonas sp.]|nr:MAG: transposase [Nitrosomonas sp.]
MDINDFSMRKSRYGESLIVAILKQNESIIAVARLYRKHGMSSAQFYKWRSKYGSTDASMMKRLKELEDENRRLKKIYAEECLKAGIQQEALEEKL